MANARDRRFRLVTGVHRVVYNLTGGRFAGRLAQMPVLELTTTGRRTGRRRTTMLTAPIEQAGHLVIVASYGGDDRHPAWFLNLRENPHVEVARAGRSAPYRARVASDAERAEWWPRVVAAYAGYGRYQDRTRREIPLVVLEPL